MERRIRTTDCTRAGSGGQERKRFAVGEELAGRGAVPLSTAMQWEVPVSKAMGAGEPSHLLWD